MKKNIITVSKILALAISFYCLHLLYKELIIKPFLYYVGIDFLTLLKVGNFIFFFFLALLCYGLTSLHYCRLHEKKEEEPLQVFDGKGLLEKIKKITNEREDILHELHCKRRMLNHVMDIVPGFIFGKDKQGRFFLVNKAVADCYGVACRDLIGKTDADFTASDDELFAFQADDQEVIETGIPKKGIMETITCYNKSMLLRTDKYPVMIWDGRPGMIGISFEVLE